jgi:hypothetical protein
MVCLPGDRFCCHVYDSHAKGRKARQQGLPCEVPAGHHSVISPLLPISEEIWVLGWKGEPMPPHIVEFCDDENGYGDHRREAVAIAEAKRDRGEIIDEVTLRWMPAEAVTAYRQPPNPSP